MNRGTGLDSPGRIVFLIPWLAIASFWGQHGAAQSPSSGAVQAATTAAFAEMPSDPLTAEQWISVRDSVDRALAWLASQQAADGSFNSMDRGQPAVTSLCALAFLSSGHLPGSGPYGEHLNRAIRFVSGCRQADGLLSYRPPDATMLPYNAAHTAIYNHAIGALLLSETYGMTGEDDGETLCQSIEDAVRFTLERQSVPKTDPVNQGGWRYIRRWQGTESSDLSVTSWLVLHLRSARNAGFEVPKESIDDAVRYIERCFEPKQKAFTYGLISFDRHITRAVTGAGVVSLSMAGVHQTEMARSAGKWILDHPFTEYRGSYGTSGEDRFFYSLFYCTLAMHQLGGEYWSGYYPKIVPLLLGNQRAEGAWDTEAGGDAMYGNAYTTALVVLSLSAPYQLLPIYQR